MTGTHTIGLKIFPLPTDSFAIPKNQTTVLEERQMHIYSPPTSGELR